MKEASNPNHPKNKNAPTRVGAQFIAPQPARGYCRGRASARRFLPFHPKLADHETAKRSEPPQKQKRPDQSRGATFNGQSVLQQQSIVKENPHMKNRIGVSR